MVNTMVASPDGKHRAELTPKGEIRFGPPFFFLSIDDIVISDRVFGKTLAWSSNSRYLAAEEWLTTLEKEGPLTRVFLLDVELRQAFGFPAIHKGFVEDFRFEGNALVYTEHYYGTGIVRREKTDISTIDNWKKI